MHEEEQTPLEKLFEELDLAEETYRVALEREREARGRASDALNKLNLAQKEVDKRIAEMKAKAPRDSEWKQRERRNEAKPV